jgi:hypothetical protein
MARNCLKIVAAIAFACGVFAFAECSPVAAAQVAGASQAKNCNRACLDGFVNQFLDALVAHDPSRLPVTKYMKYTENGQHLELGDGFWRTATARGDYKLYIEDTQAGEVGFFGTMKEAGQPVILALRLRIFENKISEAEAIVARGDMAANGAKNLDKLGKPDPIYLQDVPKSERVSRLDLIDTANKYFSGMQKDDGKGDYSFFADDCNRLENGMQTTNNPNARPARPGSYSAAWGCKQQFASGLLHFVSRIRDRRYLVVDTERGDVLAFGFFDHEAGSTRTFQTPDGKTVTAGPVTPWTWEIAELFKVQNGQIHRIQAVLTQAPYGMGSGWSSWQDSMSDKPQW